MAEALDTRDDANNSGAQLPGSLVGRVVGGKWQLENKIGSGSFGEVWVARHRVTLGQKAIKLLHPHFSAMPELVERFVREAQAAAAIDSPHVVNVDDIGHDADVARVYLVMELLRGESLYEYLVRPPYRMPHGEAVLVLRQIAAALTAAHRVGIVHRDLKPENVFLSWRADGTVMAKVLDFGIAKLSEPPPDSNPFSDGPSIRRGRTVAFIGTPGYASPEQVRDAGNVTHAADVFAFGVCAFEMLTGTTYWRSRSTDGLLEELALGAIESPSARAPGVGLSAAFDAWFLKCCALDPSERFASAEEAMSELEDALGQYDSLPAPPPRADVPQIIQTTGRRRFSGKLSRARPASDPPPAGVLVTPTPEPAAPDGVLIPPVETLDQVPPAAVSLPAPPAAVRPDARTEALPRATHSPPRRTALALITGAGLFTLALVALIRPPDAPATRTTAAAVAPPAPAPAPALPMLPEPAPEPAPPTAPVATAEPVAPAPAPPASRNVVRVAPATSVRPARRNASTPRGRSRWMNYVAPGL